MNNNKFIIKSIFVIIILVMVVAAALFSYSLFAKELKLPYGDDRISLILERGHIPDSWNDKVNNTDATLPEVNEHRLSMFYTTNDKGITHAYIEIINLKVNSIYYMEIPLNTKVSLSNELFNTLSDYGPELPQYLKLNRVENYFSRKYRYSALTKIIEEVTDTKFDCFFAVSETDFNYFLQLGLNDTKNHAFYEAFETMLSGSYSDLDTTSSYTYYETYLENYITQLNAMPGSWDVTDYLISNVTARETIEKYRY